MIEVIVCIYISVAVIVFFAFDAPGITVAEKILVPTLWAFIFIAIFFERLLIKHGNKGDKY